MQISFTETGQAPAALGPYSQAAKAGGFLFLSGQLGIDPQTGELVSDETGAQTTQVLRNLQAVLASEQLDFTAVVETMIFLTDMNDFQTVNTLYAAAMGNHRPARATVAVAALPKQARVEIKMTALLPPA